MSKKIMLPVLGALSAIMLAVPAMASATFESLHMNPTPAKLDIAGVGGVVIRGSGGTMTCGGVGGTATPAAGGTTGTMTLTFGPHCTGPGGGTCTSSNPAHTSGSILTTSLPYHLVTLKGKSPGVLVTPNEITKTVLHANCIVLGFPVQTTIEGNGVLGTITAPACGGTSTTATLSFTGTGTTQNHQQVAGVTEGTIWSWSDGGNPVSVEMHTTLTATDAAGALRNTKLECT